MALEKQACPDDSIEWCAEFVMRITIAGSGNAALQSNLLAGEGRAAKPDRAPDSHNCNQIPHFFPYT
jgi:hypothetical protein